jgi:hypothetical protein
MLPINNPWDNLCNQAINLNLAMPSLVMLNLAILNKVILNQDSNNLAILNLDILNKVILNQDSNNQAILNKDFPNKPVPLRRRRVLIDLLTETVSSSSKRWN